MKSSYFNTASKFENRVEKKWIEEKNQTLPDTDFESFFVETYDIVPQIPLQERGHLILQHLQSFVESKCNWSGGNEDEKEENKITKREREKMGNSREERDTRLGGHVSVMWEHAVASMKLCNQDLPRYEEGSRVEHARLSKLQ